VAIIKISELPAANTPLSASDVVPALQDGVTKKAAIDQLGFIADGSGATTRTIQNKLRETVSVKDFGAVGDGVANDTVAVQAAIDSLGPDGGTVLFPPGEYRIARNIGVNDRWGIKVTSSNITLKGDQAYLRRFDTNITTYANAYPILFVGVPDSNVAPLTENIIVDSLNFIGENTRHNESGSSQSDFRKAIVFKNSSQTWVTNCEFTAIDSGAIEYQNPASYDYANSQFYNTTKNYKSKINGCSFIAEPHAVSERALLHAIEVAGIDYINIIDNYFEWCDDCVSGETQYNTYQDTEDDTFTRGGGAAALGPLKRCGRNVLIDGNTVYNSSEHAFYMATMDTTISNNNIRTDEPTICKSDQIKIRGRGVTCVGNIISNYSAGITVNEPSEDVTVTGNVVRIIDSNYTGGAIDINSNTLESYINNRPFFYVGGVPDYQPMRNISIVGNTIIFPDNAVTTVDGRQSKHVAIRVNTASANANFPEGQIQNIAITSNTIKGYNVGIYCVNSQFKNCVVSNNSFFAKSFVSAGFNSGTTMNTYAVLVAYQSGAGETLVELSQINFSDNRVEGATYFIATDTGSGGAATYFLPEGMVGNRLNYIKNIKTADIRAISTSTRFNNNVGTFFLDRTWPGVALENSLRDGGSNNSNLRYTTQWTGSEYRFYTNDSAGYTALLNIPNGGTANCVVYLNGSRDPTTDSSLTYDGTKFGVVGFTESGSTDSGTVGQIVIRSRESTDQTRASVGVLRSSGATYLGRYLEPSTTIANGFNGGVTATTGGGAWIINIDGSTRYEGFASTSITKGSPVSTNKWFEISPTGKTTLYGEVEATGTIESGNTADGTAGQITIRSRESQNFTNASIGATYSSGAAYLGRAVEPSQSVVDGFNGGLTGTTGGGAWIIDNDGSTSFLSVPSVAMTKGSAVTTYPRLKIDLSGNVLNIGPGGLGYGTGSGGAVTQGTSRTTGVTLDKTNGAITLFSAAGTTAWQTFTVTNSTVAATDTVIVNQKSGTDLYLIHVTKVAAGSFNVTFATTGGATTEQPVFNFAVIKAVTA
jgi:hypothetical protein